MANKKIDSFSKKRGSENIVQSSTNNVETSTPPEQRPSKLPRVESKEVDTSSLVKDPGGRDERHESNNRGNVIGLIKLLAFYNENVAVVVLENAPQNASYHSHGIQKQILSIFSDKIQKFIREEINDGYFCILVDESEDESKREQMAIVLRFVDKYDFIKQRFFDVVHVLQALFCVECPFAYYVHCFAHWLQLALVGASKQVISINQFFSYLTRAINIVSSSCKRHDQLRAAQAADIAEKFAIDDEFETGKGKNQIRTLKRAGDTLWGSHLGSICSLINMFSATCIPDMSYPYKEGRGQSCFERDQLTMEHHFRVDIFIVTVDSQLQELNNKFKEDVMELLVLSSALDPRDGYRSFKIEDICNLANKFYPMDFTE
ncbi:uncharacterized protein LOC114303186 [Camellia sinensis]|uniref:uncharacterized protein LOC114303186 n=1 Tax=Camellia sinensis TaxID=4442 RepID=UPI0010363B9C|nr:uncharacterized protein LOC114303186 [Camellia sinensis]